jgi:hypothetical protein
MKDSPQIVGLTHYSQRGQTRLPKQNRLNNGGQALAELIIACGVLAINLFGIVTTINFSVNAVTISANKTLAVYYAQEGLEIARGMRNQGWTVLAPPSPPNPVSYDIENQPISGTIFSRTIHVGDDGINVLPKQDRRITSTVTWTDGTQVYSTKLETVLVQP